MLALSEGWASPSTLRYFINMHEIVWRHTKHFIQLPKVQVTFEMS